MAGRGPVRLTPEERALHALGDLLASNDVPTLEHLEKLPSERKRWVTIRVHVDDLIEAWRAWLAWRAR